LGSTKSHFHSLFYSLFSGEKRGFEAASLRPQAILDLEKLFELQDTKSSGLISCSDFRLIVTSLGLKVTNTQIDELFEFYKLNEKGKPQKLTNDQEEELKILDMAREKKQQQQSSNSDSNNNVVVGGGLLEKSKSKISEKDDQIDYKEFCGSGKMVVLMKKESKSLLSSISMRSWNDHKKELWRSKKLHLSWEDHVSYFLSTKSTALLWLIKRGLKAKFHVKQHDFAFQYLRNNVFRANALLFLMMEGHEAKQTLKNKDDIKDLIALKIKQSIRQQQIHKETFSFLSNCGKFMVSRLAYIESKYPSTIEEKEVEKVEISTKEVKIKEEEKKGEENEEENSKDQEVTSEPSLDKEGNEKKEDQQPQEEKEEEGEEKQQTKKTILSYYLKQLRSTSLYTPTSTYHNIYRISLLVRSSFNWLCEKAIKATENWSKILDNYTFLGFFSHFNLIIF